MLWLRITNPDYPELSVRYAAIVDTGADDCVFPAEAAIVLKHKLTSVQPKVIQGINSSSLAYPHTSKIEVLEMGPDGLPTKTILLTMTDTPIDYLVGGQNFILGTKNFLSNFILTIDYPNQMFSIRNPH